MTDREKAMSEALEALEKLCEMAHATADEYAEMGGGPENERLEKIIRAALEQPSTAEQWKPSGEEYDRSIHGSTDAMEWANLFMATFPNCGACRDTMFGWFANAMMAVHDSMPSTAEAQARALIEFSIGLKQQAQQTHSMFSEGLLHAARYAEAEAKRIREEG